MKSPFPGMDPYLERQRFYCFITAAGLMGGGRDQLARVFSIELERLHGVSFDAHATGGR